MKTNCIGLKCLEPDDQTDKLSDQIKRIFGNVSVLFVCCECERDHFQVYIRQFECGRPRSSYAWGNGNIFPGLPVIASWIVRWFIDIRLCHFGLTILFFFVVGRYDRFTTTTTTIATTYTNTLPNDWSENVRVSLSLLQSLHRTTSIGALQFLNGWARL